jgi:hypothetical protein
VDIVQELIAAELYSRGWDVQNHLWLDMPIEIEAGHQENDISMVDDGVSHASDVIMMGEPMSTSSDDEIGVISEERVERMSDGASVVEEVVQYMDEFLEEERNDTEQKLGDEVLALLTVSPAERHQVPGYDAFKNFNQKDEEAAWFLYVENKSRKGKQGQVLALILNHIRNLGKTGPAWQAKAKNYLRNLEKEQFGNEKIRAIEDKVKEVLGRGVTLLHVHERNVDAAVERDHSSEVQMSVEETQSAQNSPHRVETERFLNHFERHLIQLGEPDGLVIEQHSVGLLKKTRDMFNLIKEDISRIVKERFEGMRREGLCDLTLLNSLAQAAVVDVVFPKRRKQQGSTHAK